MPKQNDRLILAAVVLTGISSVVTQLLLIREFLAQFKGNEFVIALILFSWLLLGGTGSWLANLISRRLPASAKKLGWLTLLLAGISPSLFLTIRSLHDFFFIHGTSVGFYQTSAYIFLTIAPCCLLIGFLLPYSLFVLRSEQAGYLGTKVYMTDVMGDVTGGALFSFALVYLVTPLTAILIVTLPLLLIGWLLLGRDNRCRPVALIAVLSALSLLIFAVYNERRTLATNQADLVHYQESKYGRITVYQDQEQYTLFSDGSPNLSTQNQSVAEEAIHFPLAQLKQPTDILVISAVSGIFKEIDKYRPARVDYVELDPAMSEIQFTFNLLDRIPGLNVINQDGRLWLSRTNQTYDAIIVNLAEPDTFQTNRFFTDRFFALAKSRLTRGGILSFHMEGFDSYLAEPERRKLSILYNTAALHFKHVLLLPGQNTYFLCRDLPIDPNVPALLRDKGIQTDFISAYFDGDITPERIAYTNNLLIKDTPVNKDLAPRLIQVMFSQWFAKFNTSPTGFAVGLLLFLLFYLSRLNRSEFVLFSTGALAMGSEILVIFAFQIFFGYIYLKIGLIITVFLAGLLPGAWLGNRWHSKGRQTLLGTDLLLILLLLAFILALQTAGDRLPELFYLAFGFAVSLACGCQFPLVLAISGNSNQAASRAFSADLIGAAAGTLITSVVLVPYLGLIQATLCLIGLKVISLILLVTSHESP